MVLFLNIVRLIVEVTCNEDENGNCLRIPISPSSSGDFTTVGINTSNLAVSSISGSSRLQPGNEQENEWDVEERMNNTIAL
jgi:hypothetical protein